jgi:plasmid stabilization system protein ParE
MNLPLQVSPEAALDLDEAEDWYESQRPGLGSEFTAAVAHVLEQIESFPHSRAAGYKGVRQALTDRFPYIVYYRITEHCIEIVAVIHGSRDPRIWMYRA